jgi:hypothetical protein
MEAGCANLIDRVSEAEDSRILNPDSVQGQRQEIGATQSVAAVLGVGTVPSSPSDAATRRLRGDPDCSGGTGSPRTDFTFFCSQARSENNVADASNARAYLMVGITLSNELCTAWFSRLQVAQVSLRQTSDTISGAGSLTATILGLTETPPHVIGISQALFGSSKQAADNLAANYIVAVDLSTTSAALVEYRALYAQNIEQAPAIWNYNTARSVLMAYDNTCSQLFVRRFVNIRVNGAKPTDSTQNLIDSAIGAFLEHLLSIGGHSE